MLMHAEVETIRTMVRRLPLGASDREIVRFLYRRFPRNLSGKLYATRERRHEAYRLAISFSREREADHARAAARHLGL